MATLAVQQVIQAGLNPAFVSAAGGGDKVMPGAQTWLEVKNGGGAPVTVTVDSVTLSNFGTDVNLVVSVPAGGERRIGPLSETRFAAAADGLAAVTYSDVTSVTVAAFKI
jgi:hypothetical protein